MANILKGIDKIVTTSNTEVDLDNIQASGSGGTVSAAGLAITREEDSDSIDYSFNVGGNTHEADGHSSTADSAYAMNGAGSSGPYFTTGEKMSFADYNATATLINGLTSTHAAPAANINNNAYMFGGYGSGSHLQSIEKVQLSDDAVSQVSSSLQNSVHGSNTANDGSIALTMGGHNTNSDYRNFVQKLNGSDESVDTAYSSLSQSAGYFSTGSNGSDVLIMAGKRNNSNAEVSTVTKMSISAGGTDAPFGQLTSGYHGWGGCSNASTAFCYQGIGNQGIYAHKFDDNSTQVQFGTMTWAKYYSAQSGNGELGIAMGGWDTNATRNVDLFSQTDGSSFSSPGALSGSGHRHWCGGVSGTSA